MSRRLSSGFGIHSLSIKISFLLFVICLIVGLIAAGLMLNAEKKALLSEQHQQLKNYSSRLVSHFEKFVTNKRNVAEQANGVVSAELFNSPNPNAITGQATYANTTDGTIRSLARGGNSAAVMPEVHYSPEYDSLFYRSEMLWKVLSPPLTQDFVNFYLITKDGFIRITPSNWALNMPANYQAMNLRNFARAGHKNNPNKESVWTPVYYDKVWGKWVKSVITPIYQGSEYVALTGSDLELESLLSYLPIDDPQLQLFVVDSSGQLLAHPSIDESTYKQYGEQEKRLALEDFFHPELVTLVTEGVRLALPEISDLFTYQGEEYLIDMHKVKGIDWYVGVYKPRSSTLAALENLKYKFLVLFLLYALLAMLLLERTLNQLIVKRVRQLIEAVTLFGKGKTGVALPLKHKDELGALNRAFSNMSNELNDTINGLNKRIQEKEVAEKAANKLSKAVSFSGTGILITNQHYLVEYVNPKMQEMTGYSESHFIGLKLFKAISNDMAIMAEDIEESLQNRHSWRGDTLLKNADKQPLWVSLSISPIREGNGVVTSYVVSAQDISFVKESQRKMEQLAYFDTLTGLVNRTLFKLKLQKSLALTEKGRYSFALFYFDIDEFKRINDTLGHDTGDLLLIEVASRLKVRLRQEDTIARLGGDEFALLLGGIETEAQAKGVVDTIQHALSAPIKLFNNEVIVSASIGITLAPNDSKDEDQLLKHADLAMYEAKAKGRNTYHFYSQELNTAANERLYIENELRLGIREKQFMLHYQPQVDSRTGEIKGYESLVRWNHATEGFIPPSKFIPIAESTGLIVELGEWIIKESCAFALRQFSQGAKGVVSINLSARQFQDANLINLLDTTIRESGIDPKRLNMELTESMLMGDVNAAISQLHHIKRLGVSVSIDDFGTGYSSLNYLKRFPVDTLKIDRSFVQDIPDDASDMEITAAIIAMAQKLNLNVVAEGAETKEQVEFLAQNNCFIVQGYYYSKPVSEREIAALGDTITVS